MYVAVGQVPWWSTQESLVSRGGTDIRKPQSPGSRLPPDTGGEEKPGVGTMIAIGVGVAAAVAVAGAALRKR